MPVQIALLKAQSEFLSFQQVEIDGRSYAEILAVLVGNPVVRALFRSRSRPFPDFCIWRAAPPRGRFALFATHQFCDGDADLLHRAHPTASVNSGEVRFNPCSSQPRARIA
jgi:hypothetical protein